MKQLTYALIAFSLIGIFDAGYLSYARLTNSALNCSLLEGCNAVAASPFSVLLGIPLAYLGFLFYTAIFITSLLLLRTPVSRVLRKLVFVLTLGGFLASIYFVYVQMFRIEAFCLYCLVSAANSTILFVLSIMVFTQEKKIQESTPPQEEENSESLQ